MAYYYRKNITDTINDIKLKNQIAASTLKLGENNDKIDDLLEVDKILRMIFHQIQQKLVLMK